MEQSKSYWTELFYFSDKLQHKLNQLRFVPTAVMEAPSGYGKTTAIRDYFVSGLPQGTPVYWFTGVEETPVSAYRRLCNNIASIDREAGAHLLKIELPNAATIGKVTDALKTIRCIHETYLVIDDFQLLYNVLPEAFFKALFEHGNKNLHIIFITQILSKEQRVFIKGHDWLFIDASDLKLNAYDIHYYYSLAGADISYKDAQTITSLTDGWIIAVYLQLRAFKETGKLSDRIGIIDLMEHLLWDALTKEQKTFLLHLSPFEEVTIQQACAVTGNNILPEYALDVLQSSFIHYKPLQGQYEFHSILSELLVKKRKGCGAAFEQNCLRRAGDYFRDEGEIAKAMGYYSRIKDYQRMLSVDFSNLIFENVGNKPFAELAIDIAKNCPVNIKKDNILSMLRVAWALLDLDKSANFDILMNELKQMLDESNAEELPYLLGEWTLLSSFQYYPNLKNMTAILKKAAELFKGRCSQVILPEMPWWFGEYSPFTVFHICPGDADKEAEDLEGYISLYSKLTNGHGSGADVLFRSQLALYRGSINECEILSYKAVFLSENNKQSIVQLGAALCLAQIALLQSNAEGWQNSISSMERAASYPSQNTALFRTTLDIVRGVLFNLLDSSDQDADWLKKGDFSYSKLSSIIISEALFVHLCYLLNKGDMTRLIGTVEALMPEYERNKPISRFFLLILAAVGYLSIENRTKAKKLMKQATEIALSDGLLFLLIVFSELLQGMIEELIEREYPTHYDKYKEMKEWYVCGWEALHNAISPEELPSNLTSREYEVALHAAEGLRNSEIAQMLSVTESTVRTHLRVVFEKLQIDRRARLVDKLK